VTGQKYTSKVEQPREQSANVMGLRRRIAIEPLKDRSLVDDGNRMATSLPMTMPVLQALDAACMARPVAHFDVESVLATLLGIRRT